MTTAATFEQNVAKLLEYWRAVTRHKWIVSMGASACLLVLTIIIWKLPSEYEATTTILVDPQQVPEKYVSAAVNSDPSERLNTITQQVLSRTRLQAIMNKFHLYANRVSKVSEEELVQQMRDHVRIQVRQGSGAQLSTFTISFQGDDPQVVADVANELATSFIRWNVNDREQQVEGTQAFLSSELQAAKANLEAQEDKLRVFKMTHLGETPDQTAANLSAISSLRSTLQNNVDSYNRLEQEKVLLTHLPQSAIPANTPEVTLTRRSRLELEKRQAESNLQRLKEAYSDRYPDVVKLNRRLAEIKNELSSLPPEASPDRQEDTAEVSASAVRLDVIDREMKRLRADNSRIQAQIDSYQSKIDATPLREQQLVELSRNYDVSKQHYQTLLDKSFNIEMAVSLEQKQKAERFMVLDPAQVSEKPVKPKRKSLLVVAGLFSLVFPCLFAVGKERLSSSITTEAELASLIPSEARIVGLIPRIETPANRRRALLVNSAAAITSLLLCSATALLLWQIRPLL